MVTRGTEESARQGEGAPLGLAVLLSWVAPTILVGPMLVLGELRAPWAGIPILSLPAILYTGICALGGTWWVLWQLGRCERAARSEPFSELRRRVRRFLASIVGLALAQVAVAAAFFVGVLHSGGVWTAADRVALAVVTVMLALTIIMPLQVLVQRELGDRIGHRIRDERIVPAWLRNLPGSLLALIFGSLLPITEFVTHGQIQPAAIWLSAALVSCAVIYGAMNTWFTMNTMRPMQAFFDESAPQRLRAGDIGATAVDDLGVMTGRALRAIQTMQDLRQEEELSRKRFDDFLDASTDLFFEIRDGGRDWWLSGSMNAAFGVEKGLDHWIEVAQQEERGERPRGTGLAEFAAAIRERRRLGLAQVRLEREDGSPVHLQIRGRPVDGEGEHGIIYRGSVVDVTEVVTAATDLRDRDQALAQAQKMEAVGQLTSGVAHEFNNLLTAVTGSLDLLRMQKSELRPNALLDGAISASRQGAELVARLLSLSDSQATDVSAVELSAAIEEMRPILQRAVGDGIELTLPVTASEHWVFVDRAQLESALLNLVINARDAMGGAGRLAIELAEVSAEGTDPRNAAPWVEVTVNDTGAGIPADVLPRVVEPFFTTKSEGRGSGLGLAMVHGFAQQSGGDVRIDSEEGRGTRVTLRFPRGDAAYVETARFEPMVEGDADWQGFTALLVEDESLVRDMIRSALSSWGFEVRVAETGDDALSILNGGHRVDLLLSDVSLPGTLDGVDLARLALLRSVPVPVILCTGFSLEQVQGRLGARIRAQVLHKPFRLESLRACVTESLPPRKAQS